MSGSGRFSISSRLSSLNQKMFLPEGNSAISKPPEWHLLTARAQSQIYIPNTSLRFTIVNTVLRCFYTKNWSRSNRGD